MLIAAKILFMMITSFNIGALREGLGLKPQIIVLLSQASPVSDSHLKELLDMIFADTCVPNSNTIPQREVLVCRQCVRLRWTLTMLIQGPFSIV